MSASTFKTLRTVSKRAINWASVSDEAAVASLTTKEVRGLRKCRRAVLGAVRRIENHRAAGRIEEMRRAESNYCDSRAVKILAVLRAAHKKRRRLSWPKIRQIAGGLDLGKQCLEKRFIYMKPKDVGGKRPVCTFGIEATARQYIAADLLKAKILGNPYEYAREGRGPKSISIAIKGAIHEGYYYWIEADVVSCFASLKPGHFDDLPLPGAIKADILSNMHAIPGHNPDKLSIEDWKSIQAARHSLPQGAASSSPLASAFLGRVLRPLMVKAKVVLFTYSDNIIIGARSAEEAKAFASALRESFLALPAGPLTIKIGACNDARYRADILGWRFKLRLFEDEFRVTMCPRQRSFYRFEKRLRCRVAEGGEDFEARGHDYAQSWAKSLQWKIADYEQSPLWVTASGVIGAEIQRRAAVGTATLNAGTDGTAKATEYSDDLDNESPPW